MRKHHHFPLLSPPVFVSKREFINYCEDYYNWWKVSRFSSFSSQKRLSRLLAKKQKKNQSKASTCGGKFRSASAGSRQRITNHSRHLNAIIAQTAPYEQPTSDCFPSVIAYLASLLVFYSEKVKKRTNTPCTVALLMRVWNVYLVFAVSTRWHNQTKR